MEPIIERNEEEGTHTGLSGNVYREIPFSPYLVLEGAPTAPGFIGLNLPIPTRFYEIVEGEVTQLPLSTGYLVSNFMGRVAGETIFNELSEESPEELYPFYLEAKEIFITTYRQ